MFFRKNQKKNIRTFLKIKKDLIFFLRFLKILYEKLNFFHWTSRSKGFESFYTQYKRELGQKLDLCRIKIHKKWHKNKQTLVWVVRPSTVCDLLLLVFWIFVNFSSKMSQIEYLPLFNKKKIINTRTICQLKPLKKYKNSITCSFID